MRGYRALGIGLGDETLKVATQRAAICRASLAEFEVFDARCLGQRKDLHEQFDVVVCCETIEHILDDEKLMADMAKCLRGDGRLLLTAPNFHYKPMTRTDEGPFLAIEDGRHVRKGYTPEGLGRLCASAGLRVCEIDYCSGYTSQKITAVLRTVNAIQPVLGWVVVLPLRTIPPLVDSRLSGIIDWPGFSITLVGEKACA